EKLFHAYDFPLPGGPRMLGLPLPEQGGSAPLHLLRRLDFLVGGDGPLFAERIEDVSGTADALSKLASVTNAPVKSADVTIKMAKPDQMNRLPSKEALSVAERNDRVGAF